MNLNRVKNNNNLIKKLLIDYTVTSCGKIYSPRGKSGKYLNGGLREIKQRKRKDGYLSIFYKGKIIFVHRIIYQAFIGELDEELVINHKDGNPSNNNTNNLEQVTQRENARHKYRVLGLKPIVGHSKINKEIADKIRKDRSNGFKYKDLIVKYNLCKSSISYICNYKIWNR